MAYILNGTTLAKAPHSFERSIIEIGSTHVTISGETRKSVTKRKESFILKWRHLTQSQVTELIDIFELEDTVTFQVTEANLSIGETTVHVEISRREYNAPGNQYREDLTVILTEVT